MSSTKKRRLDDVRRRFNRTTITTQIIGITSPVLPRIVACSRTSIDASAFPRPIIVHARNRYKLMTTEQRNSYRCGSIGESQKAVLKIRNREVVVSLTNQSAGGFSVTTTQNLHVNKGKTLLVRTSAGWFEAEVVHKQVAGGNTTLGLVRLADVADRRDAELVNPGGGLFEQTGKAAAKSSELLMLTIVAAIAFWCSMWFQGVGDSGARRINLSAYMSQMVGSITSSPSAAVSSTDATNHESDVE